MSKPLRVVGSAFLFQAVVVVFASFASQKAVVLVEQGPFLGWDYHAFYQAGVAWIHGADPYSVLRHPNGSPGLVTPAPSILPGVLLSFLPFHAAALSFMVVNGLLVLFSINKLAVHLGIGIHSRRLLLAISSIYYPFLYLVERGNIDGLILACLVFAGIARRWLVRCILLALSIALKLYPLLLLAVLAARRKFAMLAAVAGLTCAFILPFARYTGSFLHSLALRGARLKVLENISPALLFGYFPFPGWKIAYFAFWGLTLGFMLWRDRRYSKLNLLAFIPWMVAFPAVVYPYCAVLYLLLLTVIVAKGSSPREESADNLFLAGFIFNGVMAYTLKSLLQQFPAVCFVLDLLAPIGSTMIIFSACAGAFDFEALSACMPPTNEPRIVNLSPSASSR